MVSNIRLPNEPNALNNLAHRARMSAYGYGSTRHENYQVTRGYAIPFSLLTLIGRNPPSIFIAGGDGHHDTSKGDSGGPLIAQGTQYGLISSGFP